MNHSPLKTALAYECFQEQDNSTLALPSDQKMKTGTSGRQRVQEQVMMTVKRQKPKSSQSSTLSHSNRGKATGRARAQNVRAPEGLGWELRSAHLPAAAERVRTQSPWPCPKRTVPLPGPGDQFQESVRTGEHQSASADMARSSLQRTVLVRGPGPQRLSLPEPAGEPPTSCPPGAAIPGFALTPRSVSQEWLFLQWAVGAQDHKLLEPQQHVTGSLTPGRGHPGLVGSLGTLFPQELTQKLPFP